MIRSYCVFALIRRQKYNIPANFRKRRVTKQVFYLLTKNQTTLQLFITQKYNAMKNNALIYLALLVAGIYACKPATPSAPASGITGYEVVVVESPWNADILKQVRANCPEGKRALGAGWSALDSTSAILEGIVTYSEPAYDGRHWLVNARNTSTFSPRWKLRVRCVCANATE